jgi:hypothetical protein
MARLLPLGCKTTAFGVVTHNGNVAGLAGSIPAGDSKPLEIVYVGPGGLIAHVQSDELTVEWTDNEGHKDQMSPVSGWAFLATAAVAPRPGLTQGTKIVAKNRAGHVVATAPIRVVAPYPQPVIDAPC